MDDREDEWSDWIEHDGSGFPAPLGTVVWRKFEFAIDRRQGGEIDLTDEIVAPLRPDEIMSWDWSFPREWVVDGEVKGTVPRVLRYKIRANRHVQKMKLAAKALDRVSPQSLEEVEG